MRKDGPPAAVSANKIFVCFETKPLVVTLLALTLVMVIWNLQPYYENILSSSATSSCSASVLPGGPPSSLPLTATSLAKTPTDPNKRLFYANGNAAALFVQMGAYRGSSRTFAVVGLASKPLHLYGRPWYECEWISNNASFSIKAKAYKILPDWGYGRVYTVVVVNCTFAVNPNQDNAGCKLILYAYYGESPKRYEELTALEEAPGSYNDSKYRPPYQYEYLYCGSSLYGNLSASRIREWMAYHALFFGPSSHFVFHDAGGVSPEVKAALEPWVRAGRVTVQDIRAQAEYDGYYYNQFLVVNDCLHRYRHAANWTFYFDVDEYIYLPDGNTLESVLKEFSNNTQFTIEQNAMSSALCLKSNDSDYSRFSGFIWDSILSYNQVYRQPNHWDAELDRIPIMDGEHCSSVQAESFVYPGIFPPRSDKWLLSEWEWGFEKLVFRDSTTKIRRDRKYAIQAKNAYATGVHMSENVIGGTLHQTETKIRYYHYHNSITIYGELCRELLPMSAKHNVTWFDNLPYVYDDNMKKLATIIKDFERSAIGSNHIFS
ncbi:glycosyltransferase family protein [Actinidia rufa]|uniref:Glycosyltransferase family 92 protein n=1 Tax=Actinidia rufa TaxID=165716 RepID=A0A7J0GIF7_9ERIC|nr:glycosyltransferase family protein [Actinidia rufa]